MKSKSRRARHSRASAAGESRRGGLDREKPDRKVLQLCEQVRRALSMALGGFGDPVLQDLVVEAVVPAPDAGRLMVIVYPSPATAGAGVGPEDGGEEPMGAEILRRLDAASGALRHEVTAAIVRKRAPELTFRVIQPAGPGEVTP